MPEQAAEEPKQVPLGEASFQDYKTAREKGLTAVPAEESYKETKKEPSDAPEKAAKPDPDPETGNEDEPKKPGGGFQRKIDKLTRRSKELETALETERRWRAENEPRLVGKPAATDKPKVEDVGTKYKTYEDYIEALADWKADSKRAEWQAKDAEDAERQASNAAFNAYQERVKEAVAKYDDYNEVVTESDLQIPQGVELAIVRMKNGPEVAYHLGKHPELCEELIAMAEEDPLLAIAEVGAIAKQLSGDRPAEKPKSQASRPIIPVGKGSTKSSVPLGEMSMQDYRKARAAGRTA